MLEGNENIAESLIKAGANVNVRTVNGKTPLQKATEKNHLKIVEVLIRHGANVNAVYNSENRTALHLASRNGFDKIVDLLLKSGASINYQNKYGRTALLKAIEGGKLLISTRSPKLKSIYSIRDVNFNVAGSDKAALLIIKHGGDVNIPDNRRRSPLQRAAQKGNDEIVFYYSIAYLIKSFQFYFNRPHKTLPMAYQKRGKRQFTR